jgi:hypothetical protein
VGEVFVCATGGAVKPWLSDGDEGTQYTWLGTAYLDLYIPNSVCVGAIVMNFNKPAAQINLPKLTIEPSVSVSIFSPPTPQGRVNTTVTFSQLYCGQTVRINITQEMVAQHILLPEVTLLEGGGGTSMQPSAPPTPSSTPPSQLSAGVPNPSTTDPSPANPAPGPTSTASPPPTPPAPPPQSGDKPNITVPVVAAVIVVLLVLVLAALVVVFVCVLLHKKTRWKPAALYTSSVRFRNSFRRKSAFNDDPEFVINKESPRPEIIVIRNCKDNDDDSIKSGSKNYGQNYAALGPSESIHHDVGAGLDHNQQQQQEQGGNLNRAASQESIHSRDVPAKMMYGKVSWVHPHTLDHPYENCGENSPSQNEQHVYYEEPDKAHGVDKEYNDRVIPTSPEANNSLSPISPTDNDKEFLVQSHGANTYEIPSESITNNRDIPTEPFTIQTSEGRVYEVPPEPSAGDSSVYEIPPDSLVDDSMNPSSDPGGKEGIYDVPPDSEDLVGFPPPAAGGDPLNTYEIPPDCSEENKYDLPADSLQRGIQPEGGSKGKGKKKFSWRRSKKEKTPKSDGEAIDKGGKKTKEKSKKIKKRPSDRQRSSPTLPAIPVPLDQDPTADSALYESPDSIVPRMTIMGGGTYAELDECRPSDATLQSTGPAEVHSTFPVEEEHTYSTVNKPLKSQAHPLSTASTRMSHHATPPPVHGSFQVEDDHTYSTVNKPLKSTSQPPPPTSTTSTKAPSPPHQGPLYTQVDLKAKVSRTHEKKADDFDEDFWGASDSPVVYQEEEPLQVVGTGDLPSQENAYTSVDFSMKSRWRK